MKKLALFISTIALFLSACDMGPVGDATVSVDTNRCTSCGACEEICPFDAIHLYGADRKPVVDPTKCTACGRCISACPEDAIYGRAQ